MEDFLKGTNIRKRGRPRKETELMEPEIIDFSKDQKLKSLEVDPEMLKTMKSGLEIDKLFSYEGGLAKAANLMFGGNPGVGKTTILLDTLSSIQNKNKSLKTCFISMEMGRRQMFKYLQRFPHFGNIETLFGQDYVLNNIKDVIEQKFCLGYDIILIDSIKVLLSKARGDMKWDKNEAEDWFVELCMQNNVGENEAGKYTSFMGIQFLNLSNGEFAGGGKLQYLFDSTFKILKDKKEGTTYIISDKNRDGISGEPLFFQLGNDSIIYTKFEPGSVEIDEDEEDD